MTSRQARSERRAAERKAKKHLSKQTRLSARAPRMDQAAFQDEPAFLSVAKTQGGVPKTPEDGKPKQAEYKASRAAAATAAESAPHSSACITPANPELLDEFTPEFLAYANSMREQITRRVGIHTSAQPTPDHGFVSQNAPAPDKLCPVDPAPPSGRASRRSEINRANAQHSTGPVTPTGKLASSRNSLKHGLASGTLIIPGEDPAALESLLESLVAEHQPADTTEEMLIREMAQSFWLAQRALRFQNDCFTEHRVDEKRLSLFLRYHTTHERAFHKALNTLIRLKKDRHKLEPAGARGFVSQHGAPGTLGLDEPALLSEAKTQALDEPALLSERRLNTMLRVPGTPIERYNEI